MLLQLDQLKDLAVASLADEARVGTVDEVVLHPQTGELVGFWVNLPGWFAPRRALSSRDIVGYDPRALLVRTSDVLVPATEIQPFRTITAQPDRWLGKSVRTESGQGLGRVTNLVIDTDLEILDSLHVSSLFGPNRILSRNQIVRVTPEAIVVSDSVVPARANEPANQLTSPQEVAV